MRLRLLGILVLALCAFGSVVGVTEVVSAFDANPICSEPKPDGIDNDEWNQRLEAAGCNVSDPSGEATATLRNVLTAVYVAAAMAAVGVIVFGGFRFAVSQGDSGKVKKAKDTIMYAVIGLVVVFLAFAITNFVLGAI